MLCERNDDVTNNALFIVCIAAYENCLLYTSDAADE